MNIDEIRQQMLRKEELSPEELEQLCSDIEEYFYTMVRGDYYTRDASWLLREYAKIHETEVEFGRWLKTQHIKLGPYVTMFMEFCK